MFFFSCFLPAALPDRAEVPLRRRRAGARGGFRGSRRVPRGFPGRGFVCENQSGAAPAAQAAGEKKFLHFAPPMLQCAQMLKQRRQVKKEKKQEERMKLIFFHI